MSSILDALERAEKERNRLDKKPFMETATVVPGLLQRRNLWIFVGLLLVVNLLIWFWVMRGSQPDDQESREPAAEQTPPRQPLATADTVVSILEQPQAGKPRKSAPPLEVEAQIPTKPVTIQTATPNVPEPTAAAPAQTSPPPEQLAKTPPVPDTPVPAAIPAQVSAEPEKTVPAAARVAKLDVAQPPAEQPRIQEKAAQLAPEQDETEQIPLLWELPARIQERLSDLKINILVYNEDAADRFVIINMHKYREGDRLEPSGMRLERITRKGIVVDYGDGLVRL